MDRAVAVLSSTAWMARAQCRDHPPAVFFPADGAGVETARRICEACPVNDACLDYALVNRIDHGVWGGTSERARRRMLRARPVEGRTGNSKSPNPSRHTATEGLTPSQSDQAKSATSTENLQGGISHVRPR
jgi:WhiB family redox-sensing transcriptional regulator